jgi:hypothetical protein
VDGEFLGDGERRLREGEDWVWDGVPAELESEMDVEDVLGRWRGYAPVSFFSFAFSLSPGYLSVGGALGEVEWCADDSRNIWT